MSFSEAHLSYPKDVSYNFGLYDTTAPVRVTYEGKQFVGQLLAGGPPHRVRLTEEIVSPGSARYIPVREIQVETLDNLEYMHQGHRGH
ncbi:MAG: hypothetical protein KGY40_05620 [Thioalkalivibrio sp.]|nr:hypothetical protein [Thioalkalivibrio sp.]